MVSLLSLSLSVELGLLLLVVVEDGKDQKERWVALKVGGLSQMSSGSWSSDSEGEDGMGSQKSAPPSASLLWIQRPPLKRAMYIIHV